jgi:mitochondrial splicing suppressor protein 51
MDANKLLIDAYRFRMEDNYSLEGDADIGSIYDGAHGGRVGFRRVLRLARSRPSFLPSWWSDEKGLEGLNLGAEDVWSSLAATIEKSGVIENHGDSHMPMQPRILGEQVYGRGPGGQSGDGMLQVQMMLERRSESMQSSTL